MFILHCEETDRLELPKKTGQIGLVLNWKKGFRDAHLSNGLFKIIYGDQISDHWLSFEIYKILDSLNKEINFGHIYLPWNRLNRVRQPQCGLLWINENHDAGSLDRPSWFNFSELAGFIENYKPIKYRLD